MQERGGPRAPRYATVLARAREAAELLTRAKTWAREAAELGARRDAGLDEAEVPRGAEWETPGESCD